MIRLVILLARTMDEYTADEAAHKHLSGLFLWRFSDPKTINQRAAAVRYRRTTNEKSEK